MVAGRTTLPTGRIRFCVFERLPSNIEVIQDLAKVILDGLWSGLIQRFVEPIETLIYLQWVSLMAVLYSMTLMMLAVTASRPNQI